MFSGDLMGRVSPLLLFCTEPVSLNVVIHNRIDFWSGTGPNGAILKRFRKARWVETTEPPLEKIGLYGKHTLLVTPPHDGY
jgi:hypothetical protein